MLISTEVHSKALLYARIIDYFTLEMSSPLNP